MAAEESALEVVEEAVDHLAPLNLNGTTKAEQATVLALMAAIGAVAGGTITYFVVRKRLRTYYEDLANEEIAEAQKFYSQLHKDGEFSDPENLVASGMIAENINKDQGYTGHPALAPIEEEDDEEVVVPKEVKITRTKVTNIFTESMSDQEFDLEMEMAKRTDVEPFIITQEEYMENEPDFPTMTLTYYEDDEILLDDKGEVIPDADGVVGDDNLSRFGAGSKDRNILYVRNVERELNLEIARHSGSYSQDVLGFKHSDGPRTRKFRRGDDE